MTKSVVTIQETRTFRGTPEEATKAAKEWAGEFEDLCYDAVEVEITQCLVDVETGKTAHWELRARATMSYTAMAQPK